MQQEIKVCKNCKNDFIIEPEDFNFYEKIRVPPPTFCPECREQRRLAFRNERYLYKRNCNLCGGSVVSIVSPDKKYPMYCSKCWWSDKWDPYSYGREYDFSRPFFEQWSELFLEVPHISIFNSNSKNSDWVNQESNDKNCYLNVGGHYNEDSAYNTYELYGKNSYDNYWLLYSEYCSNNIHVDKSYFTHFSENCDNCMNTLFSYDCHNCNDVIGCAGLRNKKYCVLNEQLDKAAYENFLKEHPYSSESGKKWWIDRSKIVWNSFPCRENSNVKILNSFGNYLYECKNAKNCWECAKIENARNIYIAGWGRDMYDCSSFGAAELCYECAHSGGAYDSKFILFCLDADPMKQMNISHIEYCAMVMISNNCFGCVGLRGGEYSILNKKYSKSEYGQLLSKIVDHMKEMPYKDKNGRIYRYGEFFPIEFSPFGYNETVANEYFPLTRGEAEAQGFNWCEYSTETKHEFSEYKIPNDIVDVGDEILEKVLKCEETGKAYKIIPMELSFYRKAGLPIPRISPLARHNARMVRPLPRKFFKRQCDNCQKEINTPYSKDRPETVYCVECYQKEVY